MELGRKRDGEMKTKIEVASLKEDEGKMFLLYFMHDVYNVYILGEKCNKY